MKMTPRLVAISGLLLISGPVLFIELYGNWVRRNMPPEWKYVDYVVPGYEALSLSRDVGSVLIVISIAWGLSRFVKRRFSN